MLPPTALQALGCPGMDFGLVSVLTQTSRTSLGVSSPAAQPCLAGVGNPRGIRSDMVPPHPPVTPKAGPGPGSWLRSTPIPAQALSFFVQRRSEAFPPRHPAPRGARLKHGSQSGRNHEGTGSPPCAPAEGPKGGVGQQQPAGLPASALPWGPSPHSPGTPFVKCQIGENGRASSKATSEYESKGTKSRDSTRFL